MFKGEATCFSVALLLTSGMSGSFPMNFQKTLILCVLLLSVVMNNTRALSLDGTVIFHVCMILYACISFLYPPFVRGSYWKSQS